MMMMTQQHSGQFFLLLKKRRTQKGLPEEEGEQGKRRVRFKIKSIMPRHEVIARIRRHTQVNRSAGSVGVVRGKRGEWGEGDWVVRAPANITA